MKNPYRLVILISAAVLTGCASNRSGSADKEVLMPRMQQNTYLSHARSPQQYGFQIFRTRDGVAFNGSTRLHPNHRASIRLASGNIPVVEMRGRSPRMKAKALLDPSSPSSWMEFTTSQNFGAVFMAHQDTPIPYRGGYNLGNADAYAAVATQLRFDQLIMENTPLYVRMAMHSLGPLARGIQKPHVDAIIGYDVLSQFEYVQFNFDAGVVQFSSSKPYVPHQDLLMTKARIVPQPNFGLAVEGAIFGDATPIVLDFAGDYSFARGDVKVSSTKQVSIGDLVYRKVPTLLLPANSSPPRAGRRMLEKYIVTIAPREGAVYFERFPE